MPQTFATKSFTPSSSNRTTAGHHVNPTTTPSSQAPAPTPQIRIASSPTPSPSPATPSHASSRAPSPRVAGPSTSQQHSRRPSTSPEPSSPSPHHRDPPPHDADRLRAANAGFARAMAGTSAVRARAKSDTGPASSSGGGGTSPKASSLWERPGSSRRSGEVDDELERRWVAWERGELGSGSGSTSDRVVKSKSTKAETGCTKTAGGGTVVLQDQEYGGGAAAAAAAAAGRPPPQPAPGLLKRLRSKIVKDKDRVKEIAESVNDPSPDLKYGPY